MITTPTTEARNWGEEITLITTGTHCAKLLKRKAGTKGGFQLHVKEESHYLLSGRMLIRRKQQGRVIETEVCAGVAWTVPPLLVHQEEAIEDSVVIEVSDPTVEDRYGIEPDPGGLPSMTDAEAIVILQNLEQAFTRRAEECRGLAQHVWHRSLDRCAAEG